MILVERSDFIKENLSGQHSNLLVLRANFTAYVTTTLRSVEFMACATMSTIPIEQYISLRLKFCLTKRRLDNKS